MTDVFEQVDTASLDELEGLDAEIAQLRDRIELMRQRQEDVSPVIYRRVSEDYATRMKELQQRGVPLRAEAKRQLESLKSTLSVIESEYESIRLDREELEFRHALGEFDADALKTQLVDSESSHARLGKDLEAARIAEQRFSAVLDDGKTEHHAADDHAATAELTLPDGPVDEPSVVEEPASKGKDGSASADDEADRATAKDAGEAITTLRLQTLEFDDQAQDPEATRLSPVPTAGDLAPFGTAQSEPSDHSAAVEATRILSSVSGSPLGGTSGAPRADQTLMLRTAKLVPQSKGDRNREIVLALKPTLFGAGRGCDVMIEGAADEHAEIRVSMAGFTLASLGGPVRINGVDMERHLLRHLDRIEILGEAYVFHDRQ